MEKKKFQSKYVIIKGSVENQFANNNGIETKISEYPNNFSSNEKIIEKTIELNHNVNTGFSKDCVFNGIRIEQRELNLLEPLEVEVLSLNYPCFRMHFTLEGDYSYTSSNSESIDFQVNKGFHQLFFFPKVKDAKVRIGANSNNYKSLELTLSLDFIHRVFRNSWEVLDVLGSAIKNRAPLIFGGGSEVMSSEIYAVIQQIQNCVIKKELKKAYLEAKVIELLVLQIDSISEAKNAVNASIVKNLPKIKTAKAFIEANIDSNLTIPFIAKHVGLNINYLKSEFKELYSETIFQYLTSLRMQHANYLITQTDYSITEIANKVGYKHAQHFTKVFKKYFNKTPSILRKEKIISK